MRRAGAALFLSAALHTAVLFGASYILRAPQQPPRLVMRVALMPQAVARAPEALGRDSLPPAVPQKTPEKKEPVPKPIKAPTPKRATEKAPPKPKPADRADTAPPQQTQQEYLPETPGAADTDEAPAATLGGEPGPSGPSGLPGAVPGSSASSRAILDASSLSVTKRVTPDYPMISRKRKESGTVVLLIEIASGRVASVEVESSSGHAPLDESAIRAVKGWEFDAGHDSAVLARIPFKFELK